MARTRQISSMPAQERAEYVNQFVGEHITITADWAGKKQWRQKITGAAIALAKGWGSNWAGHVLVVQTDDGDVLAFPMTVLRYIERVTTEAVTS